MSKCDKKRIQSHKSISLYDFTDRFCHKLKLCENKQKHIGILSKLCEELNLVNDNTPPAMAAGCIYLYIRILKLDIDKKQISEVCKISEVTITKTYRKMQPYEDELIPSAEIINQFDNAKTYENTTKLKLYDIS